MSHKGSSDATGLLAARAALLLLTAAVSGRGATKQFLLLPDSEPLDADQAAARMAAMDKPVHCDARIRGRVLEITAEREAPGDRPVLDLGQSTVVGAALAAAEDSGAGILLIGADESLLLPGTAVRAWARDYPVSVPFTVAGREPRDEQREHGIARVLEIGPGAISSQSIDDITVPEPFRSALAEEFRLAMLEHTRKETE